MASSKKLTKMSRLRVASLTGEPEHAARRSGQLSEHSGGGNEMTFIGEQGLWPMQQPGLQEESPPPAVTQPEADCPPEPTGQPAPGRGLKPRPRRHRKGCKRICRCVRPAGSRTKKRTGAAPRRTGTGTGTGTARRRTGNAAGTRPGCGCAPRRSSRIGCGAPPLRGLRPLGRCSCGCRKRMSR